MKKYRAVFAQGIGVARHKATTFNAEHDIDTTTNSGPARTSDHRGGACWIRRRGPSHAVVVACPDNRPMRSG